MIHFQRMSTDVDAVGQQIQTWTEVGEGWAAITPLTGREFFLASGEGSTITHKIETSYQPSLGLTSRDRIAYHGRVFDMHSVINKNEANKDWILMCIEVISTT